MAGFLSTTRGNTVLDSILGSGSPATLYGAIMTVAPSSAGTGGTEAAGTGYARAVLTNNATNFPAAVSKQKSNAVAFGYVAPGSSWGTGLGVAWYDAATGGTFQFYSPFDVPVSFAVGTPARSFAIGAFVATIT